MSTMNVSLPDDMKGFVDQQVVARGYSTSSEYVRDLIRKEQDRQHLRSLILEGMASGRGEVADEAYFERLRERVRQGVRPSKAGAKAMASEPKKLRRR